MYLLFIKNESFGIPTLKAEGFCGRSRALLHLYKIPVNYKAANKLQHMDVSFSTTYSLSNTCTGMKFSSIIGQLQFVCAL